MRLLRKQLDRYAPLFEDGGKLSKFYPLYEAADSFLFTPGQATQSGPHVRDGIDLKRLMVAVVHALIPCVLFGAYNVGYQELHAADPSLGFRDINVFRALFIGLSYFVPIYAVTMIVGGLLEALFASVRKHEINEGFLVTGLLLPLTLPATIPLWQVAVAVAFGVVIGKEAFGGTGMNILNPALTARLFLYMAYPAQISGDKVWVTGAEHWADGYSGATVLADFYATGTTSVSWFESFIGLVPGSFGETSVLACLMGAGFLLFSGIASWRIMLSCLLGLVSTTLLLNFLAPSPEHYMAIPAHWHIVTGGFAFGAIFMATDPVSAAQTNTGRWIYGFLIGALTVIVRVLNPAYPEGIMLAIIFMNVFAPTIDYYVTKANIRRREARLGVQ